MVVTTSSVGTEAGAVVEVIIILVGVVVVTALDTAILKGQGIDDIVGAATALAGGRAPLLLSDLIEPPPPFDGLPTTPVNAG